MTILMISYDGKKVVKYSSTPPSSYSTGGWLVTIDELNKVDEVLEARLTGGYNVDAVATPVATNKVTVKAYTPSPTGAPSEVTPGADLSSETLTLIVLGT